MEQTTLNVTGMSCGHCAEAVRVATASVAGVADVTVSLQSGTVSFRYEPSLAPIEAVKAAIIEEGYNVAG